VLSMAAAEQYEFCLPPATSSNVRSLRAIRPWRLFADHETARSVLLREAHGQRDDDPDHVRDEQA
jgi:hypothetical protein